VLVDTRRHADRHAPIWCCSIALAAIVHTAANAFARAGSDAQVYTLPLIDRELCWCIAVCSHDGAVDFAFSALYSRFRTATFVSQRYRTDTFCKPTYNLIDATVIRLRKELPAKKTMQEHHGTKTSRQLGTLLSVRKHTCVRQHVDSSIDSGKLRYSRHTSVLEASTRCPAQAASFDCIIMQMVMRVTQLLSWLVSALGQMSTEARTRTEPEVRHLTNPAVYLSETFTRADILLSC
jgi:hypothetical protein